MSNVVALKLPVGASKGRLPLNYEHAREALVRCERIDECKEWADKAEALASYAFQQNDETLFVLARRIKARATRRCGELLKQFDAPGKRTDKPSSGDDTRLSQREAAERAGLSKRQQVTAVRVANVPEAQFEQAVESDKPPTISQLALMARNRRPRPDTPSPRVEETQATSPLDDFLMPADADRAIVLLAERVDSGLFLPAPGQLACLREAFARASPKHRKAIQEAAYTLSELVK